VSEDCYFCKGIQTGRPEFFDVGSELFLGRWDFNPVTPGHVLIMPKRHVQYSHALSRDELSMVMAAVVAAKEMLRQINLRQQYQTMLESDISDTSKGFVAHALEKLSRVDNRPPDAFNDGVNDGPAAGQTIPHFHWHIMPRWKGDIAEPRGGIRGMFGDMGDYEQSMPKTGSQDNG
jgi:diadenosine tetraphosphate (Ap4A) HIT family hydrolase